MHHDNLPSAVAMWMRVFFGRSAMRRPACVPDSVGAFDGRFLQHFFQIAQFSWSAADFQLAIVDYGDARRVIAAIFELAQAFDYDRDDLFRSNVTDNSTHGAGSPECKLGLKALLILRA